MEIKLYLSKSADILCDYGCFVESPGLLNGRMGIALYLYRCARSLQEDKYELYADDLLDGVLNDLHIGMQMDMHTGLAGIGIGLEYLMKNKFISVETTDLLDEVDALVRDAQLSDQDMASYWLARGHKDELYLDMVNRKQPDLDAGKVSLQNLLSLSLFNLVYTQNLSLLPWITRIRHLINDPALLDNFLKLSNRYNLGLNFHLTGCGWMLLDYQNE